MTSIDNMRKKKKKKKSPSSDRDALLSALLPMFLRICGVAGESFSVGILSELLQTIQESLSNQQQSLAKHQQLQ